MMKERNGKKVTVGIEEKKGEDWTKGERRIKEGTNEKERKGD